MKRLATTVALGILLCGAVASAQVPRTVLCEMASATW